jgi:hypothetical protein
MADEGSATRSRIFQNPNTTVSKPSTPFRETPTIAHQWLWHGNCVNCAMTTAIAQSPFISDSVIQPRQKVAQVRRPAAAAKSKAQVTGYAAKSVVILSGMAMMYVLINHGQIFQNYLQW